MTISLNRILRLPRDRIVIALSPESLALVRSEGLLRPRFAGSRVVRYTPALGVESWQAAVESLREIARDLKDIRANVTIVLSNHFVRYTLVPPGEGLDRDEEELAFARYCFAKVHGARSKSWEVRMNTRAGAFERLAGAIDTALLDALHECFPAEGKLRLVSVQPYLMAAFNRWRRTLELERAWFLLIEPHRFCLGLFEGGRWLSLRNTKAELDSPEDWAEMLEREQHLVDCEELPADAYIHAPHAAQASFPNIKGWSFRNLSLPAIPSLALDEAAPLSMALCAA
jgi:hypothetical protein